jgi:hypothetical protein
MRHPSSNTHKGGVIKVKANQQQHLGARVQTTIAAIALTTLLAAVMVSTGSSPAGARVNRPAGGPGQLREQFALLHAPMDSSPPPALARAVARAPTSYELRLADARQSAVTGAWLIPGDGWLCIATVFSEGLGMSCATRTSAENGQLRLIERSNITGEEHIVGAVPNGHSAVSALDGSSTPLASSPVSENTYTMTALNAARVAGG